MTQLQDRTIISAPVFPDSSNLNAVGFQDGLLYVRFKKQGDVYVYEGASYTVFAAILAAESPGNYFHRRVKEAKLPYRKLDYDPFTEAIAA